MYIAHVCMYMCHGGYEFFEMYVCVYVAYVSD